MGHASFSGNCGDKADGAGENLLLLNQFIRCSVYENIIFCWVMHEQGIIDEILSKLETSGCRIHHISLLCSSEELRKRLQKDVDAGIRTEDVIPRSIARLGFYREPDTEKIDVSHMTPEQAAERIMEIADRYYYGELYK